MCYDSSVLSSVFPRNACQQRNVYVPLYADQRVEEHRHPVVMTLCYFFERNTCVKAYQQLKKLKIGTVRRISRTGRTELLKTTVILIKVI